MEEVHDMLVSLQTIPVDDDFEDEPVIGKRSDSSFIKKSESDKSLRTDKSLEEIL